MNSYGLTEEAADDLVTIFLDGIESFGLSQARYYRDRLERCFALLANNPRMGRPADAFSAGARRHEHGSHVIFYEEALHGVLVIAIVHQRSIRRLISK
jgi:toxin ParE1/3/4